MANGGRAWARDAAEAGARPPGTVCPTAHPAASRTHQLLAHAIQEGLLGPAGQKVGGQPHGPQHGHRVLGGLGLLLAHYAQNGHERHVHAAKVGGPHPELELAQGLDKRHGLDVAHRTAQLNDADVGRAGAAVDGDVGDALNPVLDGVRDVGHDLHGLAQVVAPPLLLDDGLG